MNKYIKGMGNKMNIAIENSQEYENKTEFVYRTLKQSIIKNELKPNTMLIERQLSEAFNVSRTPVKQALLRLENEGLVEIISGKGIFVSAINVADIIEIYSLRAVLDPFIIGLCMERNDPKTYKRLKNAVDEQIKALDNKNYREFLQYDLMFHRIYIEESNNKRLQQFMGSMNDQLDRLANTTVDDLERAKKSIEHHKRILDAYANKDIKLVKKLTEEHMQDVKEYFINKFLKNEIFDLTNK